MSRLTIPSIETSPAASLPFWTPLKTIGCSAQFNEISWQQPCGFRRLFKPERRPGQRLNRHKTGERIALAIAEINRCDYCLSAHTYLATHVAKLDNAEITANRQGTSGDAKADAAVRFAARVAKQRGWCLTRRSMR